MRALREFVQQGGTLVLLNRACGLAIESLGVGVKNVLAGSSSRDFYAPGSLLRVQLDTRHPLAWGMEAETAAWFEHGPAFEIPTGADGVKPVGVFPDVNPLLSGWLLGEGLLHKRGVVLDAQAGRGHIVLFGIRPQYRAQSHGTYPLLFNALYYF